MKTNSLKKQNEEFQDSFQKVRNKYSELILYYLIFGRFSLFYYQYRCNKQLFLVENLWKRFRIFKILLPNFSVKIFFLGVCSSPIKF